MPLPSFSPPDSQASDPLANLFGTQGMFDAPSTSPETEITAKIGKPAPELNAPDAPAAPTERPNPSSAFAMSTFGTVPKDFNTWVSDPANVQKIPGRPWSPQTTGQKVGMGVATALDTMGSALLGRSGTVGKNWLDQIQAGKEYDREAPVLQQQANQGAYGRYLQSTEAQANVAHTNVETQNASMINPWYQKAAELKNSLAAMWQSGTMNPQDFDKAVALQLQGNPYSRMITPDVIAQIKQLPQKPPTVNSQDDIPLNVSWQNKQVPIARAANGKASGFNLAGKIVPFGDPSLPPELQAKVPEITAQDAVHAQKRGEKLADETFVAGAAADRQGKQITAAINAAQQGEANKTLNQGREIALKHLTEMRSAQNQNELVQQLAKSKSPTDQTSLVFKSLGIDLPPGTSRINKTELDAIRNQGDLSDRAYSALLNWTTGQVFAPEIIKDIANTANRIANSKIKNANDNLRDVKRVYGYQVANSGPNGGLDEAPSQSSQPSDNTAPEQAIKDYAAKHNMNPDQVRRMFKAKGITIQ